MKKKNKTKSVHHVVRMPEKTYKKLARLAKEEGITIGEFLTKVI